MAAPEPGTAAPDAASLRAAAPVGDDELDALLAPLLAFQILILAVSGGADSMALMHLAARHKRMHPAPERSIIVATVDHELRAGARAEAEWVMAQAQALGFEAELLAWSGDKPATGIQEAARGARYELLSELAGRLAQGKPAAVVTAHTEDDQAETLLMRLARGSGIDGLAAMAERRAVGEQGWAVLLRPLLGVPGARLRATLQAAGVTWIEDPSNDAERFERVRVRKSRALLAELGLDNDKLALSARRLARARAALDVATDALQHEARLDLHAGAFASFDRDAWLAASEELRLRLVGRLIGLFGGQSEPLRLVQLEGLAARMQDGVFEGATLAGAVIARHGAAIRVAREAGRAPLPTLVLTPGAAAIWDRRFRVAAAPGAEGSVEVGALGAPAFARLRQQLAVMPELPASAAATLPAFWAGEKLLAVPYLDALQPEGPETRAGRLFSAEFLGQSAQ